MKNILAQIIKFQKSAVWILIVLNIVLAGGYVYTVNRTVFNVVASTKAEKALAQSSAASADLESRYVSLKNKITLDFAYAQGFQDASNQQIFIVKKPVIDTLSFNAH
jgi:ribosomal protein L18